MLYLAPARNGKTEVAKKISMLSDAYFLFDGNRLIIASQAGQKPFMPGQLWWVGLGAVSTAVCTNA